MRGLPVWALAHTFLKAKIDNKKYTEGKIESDGRTPSSIDNANMVSSLFAELPDGTRYHRPFLDIDMDARLIPSTTPYHFHLYLDKVLTEDAYEEVLTCLAKHGIVQQGILNQFHRNHETSLRLPDVKKPGEITPPLAPGGVIKNAQKTYLTGSSTPVTLSAGDSVVYTSTVSLGEMSNGSTATIKVNPEVTDATIEQIIKNQKFTNFIKKFIGEHHE